MEQQVISIHVGAEAKLSVVDESVLLVEGRDVAAGNGFQCLAKDKQEGYWTVVSLLLLPRLFMNGCYSRRLPLGGSLTSAEAALEYGGDSSS